MHELLALILRNLNAFLASRALSPFYHIPKETETKNKIIAAILLEFEKKISKVEENHLRRYAQILGKDLDFFGITYLKNRS